MSKPAESLNSSLLSDQAYELLRARLVAHEYPPGRRLVESEIARQLSVSQAPIRDALRRLAHEGLVLQLPRRGSFVAEISAQQARNAYEVRAALETVAVRSLLTRLDDEILRELDGCVEAMTAAADADDLSALIAADVAFHSTVWKHSGNALLTRIWPMVESSMRSLTLVSNRLYFANLAEVARTHPPLVEGLRRHDPQVADDFHDHALVVWRLLATE